MPLTPQQALALAMQHHGAGRLKEAETLYAELLALDPRNSDIVHLRGALAYQAGQFQRALELMERAIAIKPGVARYHLNLAPLLMDLGRLDEAAAACEKAIALEPGNATAHYNLGLTRQKQGKDEAAIAGYREVLRVDPGHRLARLNLGNVYRRRGRLDDATQEYRRLLEIHPDDADAYHNLGIAMKDRGQLDEAVTAYEQALRLRPDDAETLSNLGNVWKDGGQLDEAIALYRRALAISPDHALIHSNLACTLQFHPGCDAAALHAENRRWNARQAKCRPKITHANGRDAARRLKVGYVSPHFYSQAECYFVLPLLRAHDRAQFEIHCYSSVARPDEMTRRFRETGAVWHDVQALSNEALAEQIHAEGIDILVDLTMHMDGSRLPMYARKPSPVQVTWLAYPGGTGLDAMDYRISDWYMDPPGVNEAYFTEQTVRLPDSWCVYDPITELPPVSPLPALARGYFTFGSLNNFCKVNDEVLRRWIQVMHAVPTSRLILRAPEGKFRTRLEAFFRGNGVKAERLDFVGGQLRGDYLEMYRGIDLALDPFPYNGITTTCDALWMGVPVLTLPGRTPSSRAGLGLLATAGLPEFVAASEEGYIAAAVAWASNLTRLAAIRSGLRAQVQQSPLSDPVRFARNMESAYRRMWERWCYQSK